MFRFCLRRSRFVGRFTTQPPSANYAKTLCLCARGCPHNVCIRMCSSIIAATHQDVQPRCLQAHHRDVPPSAAWSTVTVGGGRSACESAVESEATYRHLSFHSGWCSLQSMMVVGMMMMRIAGDVYLYIYIYVDGLNVEDQMKCVVDLLGSGSSRHAPILWSKLTRPVSTSHLFVHISSHQWC